VSAAPDGIPAVVLDIFGVGKGNTPAPSPAPTPAGAGANPAYVQAAVRDELAAVAAAPEGVRNDTLNRAAFNLGTLVAAGGLGQREAHDALVAAGIAAGLGEREADATALSGLKAGSKHPRAIPAPQDGDSGSLAWIGGVDTATGEIRETSMPDRATIDDFWNARQALRVIKDTAHARMTAPWATLGNALANVIAATPVDIVLPPTIGGRASLNLFVGIVGPSGAGKGASAAAAEHAIAITEPAERRNVGTGEGLISAFVQSVRGGGQEWVRHNCLISVAEIDSLAAVAKRQGATIMPVLRSAWSGETLGFQNRDRTTAVHVPAMEYRMALVAGIQPARADVLLGDSDGGTPQRFMWMPAIDPDATLPTHDAPAPWMWPGFTGLRRSDAFGQCEMTIPGHVADQLRRRRVAILAGQADSIAGHDGLARLKIAAALACLDGRLDVRDEDWDLAGVVHDVSVATRTGVGQELAKVRRKANAAAGEAEAARAVIVDEGREEAAIRRVSRVVERRLTTRGPATAREIKVGVTSRDRGHLEVALDRLLATGRIRVAADSRAGTDVYEVAP
jgi:hypothetical protein